MSSQSVTAVSCTSGFVISTSDNVTHTLTDGDNESTCTDAVVSAQYYHVKVLSSIHGHGKILS